MHSQNEVDSEFRTRAMRRPVWLLAPLVLMVSVARVAIAQSTEPPPPPSAQAAPSASETVLRPPCQNAEPETRWYGYQNMLIDVGGILLAVVAVHAQSDALGGFAVATYLGGSPAVHFGHGHVGKGLGSLAIRIFAPLVGAGLGCAAYGSQGEFGCLGGILVGGFAFGVAGVIVDDIVLAHEEVPKEATQRPQFTPRIALAQESGRLMPSVGLGGTF